MYLQKVISRRTLKKIILLLASWRSMTKISGSGSESGSRSVSHRHGSADPDPDTDPDMDPHQIVMYPQHWFRHTILCSLSWARWWRSVSRAWSPLSASPTASASTPPHTGSTQTGHHYLILFMYRSVSLCTLQFLVTFLISSGWGGAVRLCYLTAQAR
jgi:hypothetical protein